MADLIPIETPIGAITNRVEIGARVRQAWPDQPTAIHSVATAILSDPSVPSDALLIVAGALDQASLTERLDNRLMTAAGLGQLANLFRDAAPDRADVPLWGHRKEGRPL